MKPIPCRRGRKVPMSFVFVHLFLTKSMFYLKDKKIEEKTKRKNRRRRRKKNRNKEEEEEGGKEGSSAPTNEKEEEGELHELQEVTKQFLKSKSQI